MVTGQAGALEVASLHCNNPDELMSALGQLRPIPSTRVMFAHHPIATRIATCRPVARCHKAICAMQQTCSCRVD